VIGCAKHFPGHGASSTDTHTYSGVVELTLEELNDIDLVPFRALVDGGVGLVMAAHLTLPKVDADPVFLSKPWLGAVLRSELGFKGVVLSDDMEMAAAQNEGDPVDVALQALFAGCDLLIYGRNLPLSNALDPSQVASILEQVVPDYMIEASTERLWGLRK
jgi:beta-N-acetylhexosaminidase